MKTRLLLLLPLAMIAFAASPILVRLAMAEAPQAPPLAIAFWRALWAIALLALPVGIWRREELKRIRARDGLWIALAGAFLALHFTLWVYALRYTSVASASVLVSIHPIFIAILGYWWLRERLSFAGGLGVALATLGGALIGWGDARQASASFPQAPLGNALAVSSALCFAGYLLVGRLVRQRISWLLYVGLLYGVVALLLGVLLLAMGLAATGYTRTFYGLCAFMALGPQLIGHGTLNYLVRFLTPALVALVVFSEPLLASLMAYALWGEVPGLVSGLGMVLTLGGLLLAWWPRPSAAARPRAE